MASRRLILIKHARPAVEADVAPEEWVLSEAGKVASATLAERLRPMGVGAVYCSFEPKAEETARIVGEKLGVRVEAAEGLEEHDRSNVPMMRTGEFISAIAQFFREPDLLVLGQETADEAGERFNEAIDGVMRKSEAQTVAVVTHGTVIALFAESRLEMDSFTLWRAMQLPSYLVIDWNEMKLVERVDSALM